MRRRSTCAVTAVLSFAVGLHRVNLIICSRIGNINIINASLIGNVSSSSRIRANSGRVLVSNARHLRVNSSSRSFASNARLRRVKCASSSRPTSAVCNSSSQNTRRRMLRCVLGRKQQRKRLKRRQGERFGSLRTAR